MRVPEAYLLLRPFDTTRPGLLVLDADARRVASIPLAGKPDVVVVAGELTKALEGPPRERVLVRVQASAAEDVARRLGAIDGVETPEASPSGFVAAWCAKGALTPDHVAGIAAATKREVEVVDPVPVRVKGARMDVDVLAELAKIAGLRHVGTAEAGTTAWISRWLLRPAELAARGLEGDVAALVYRFENLPRGARAVPHLTRPLSEKGVVSVVPRVDEGVIELVVRPKSHDPDRTLAALKKGGLTPIEK